MNTIVYFVRHAREEPMPTIVSYVRHAEPDRTIHDDPTRPLTPKGLADRERLLEYFQGKRIDAILSSPYKRAVDTIRPLAEQRGLAIETIYAFRERRVDSVWIDEFDSFCRHQWEDFSYTYTDGESLGEVQMRNIDALNKVLHAHAGEHLVIGGHGTAVSTIINYYQPKFDYDCFLKIKHWTPFVTKFVFEGDAVQSIELVNVMDGKTAERIL